MTRNDEKPPWPAPDPWQCEYETPDGRRCVFGKGHTVNYHLPQRVEPLVSDSFLPDQPGDAS